MRYTVKELQDRETISAGQTDNLKIDTGTVRVWLSRCGVEDGNIKDNLITIERLINGSWEIVDLY